MEGLYNRMATSITQNPSRADRSLATNILQCVSCSLRVLTVTELSHALDEGTSEVLDLTRSIVDLCGGFIVVDNDGHVAMIHRTAREYLLTHRSRPVRIDRNAAHVQLFQSCMRCLMTVGLRAKINRNQTPDFLDYAAGSWSSHLASTLADSDEVSEVLRRFLTGNWVLAWIHFLAAKQQLRVLVSVSRHLSRFAEKRKQHMSDTHTDTSVHVGGLELVESWAVDLVKVLGKFGNTLRRDPESIYKTIAPFCPKNSAIYQLFGNAEAKNLAVSGISTSNWDDSLARISPGLGAYASSICAAGSQIAILSSSGDVSVWDASTFEETVASPLKHGERVYRFEINSSATLLATYGYRTIKIWEVATGACKLSVDNIESRPRPLAMLFSHNNTTLIVGSDDGRIRSLDLTLSNPTWQLVAELEETELDGHFRNGSNYMALNRDGTLVAAAYRGYPFSAWVIEGPEHIGHCWRKREAVARGEVIAAAWHPHSPDIIGLYLEGVVFKWSPYENEVEELSTGASRLALSKDGELFATGDVHGTVKVYTTSGLCLLYQLTSQDTVLDLSFSPDLQRFYDIRGHYGNAWEPNVLMRYATRLGLNDIDDGSESESLAQVSTASMSASLRVDSITVVAASPTGRLYCYGTERGTVGLHDAQHGKVADIHAARGFLSIEHIAWSGDGRWVCFSDSSKKIFVVSVTTTAETTDPVVETKAEMPMKNVARGPVQQLMFKPGSKSLLVQAASSLHVVSLEGTPSVVHSLDVNESERKCISSPNPELLVVVEPDFVRILDWRLRERHTREVTSLLCGASDRSPVQAANEWRFERVLLTYDKTRVLAQIIDLTHVTHERILVSFEISSLLAFATATSVGGLASHHPPLQLTVLPKEISSQVNQILSFHSHGRLIFLSRTLSICSWPLSFGSQASPVPVTAAPQSIPDTKAGTWSERSLGVSSRVDGAGPSAIKELFPLPGDWVSRDCLALSSIWEKERAFLCPRNGGVVVVKCAALM